MVRNLTRNQAPGNRLWVRIPCPPLRKRPFPTYVATFREFLRTYLGGFVVRSQPQSANSRVGTVASGE
jgi:hypothetical protein